MPWGAVGPAERPQTVRAGARGIWTWGAGGELGRGPPTARVPEASPPAPAQEPHYKSNCADGEDPNTHLPSPASPATTYQGRPRCTGRSSQRPDGRWSRRGPAPRPGGPGRPTPTAAGAPPRASQTCSLAAGSFPLWEDLGGICGTSSTTCRRGHRSCGSEVAPKLGESNRSLSNTLGKEGELTERLSSGREGY